jgi:REP element-mobilizing transposase RayT
MSTSACYRPETTNSAYALRWSWTGWPSQGLMPTLEENSWLALSKLWEQDGIRLLERKCTQEHWQATFSTKPSVAPSLIVARVKGRIDHHCRTLQIPFKFSRKVALRAIGNNTSEEVQHYIRKQVDSAKFVDSKFAEAMKQFTRVWDTDSNQFHAPVEVSSGRYWYQLHLVLVVEGRDRIGDMQFLARLFETFQTIALNHGYHLGGISVMPDHVHLSLRGIATESPETIALWYMNETCFRLNVMGLWRPSYYVGTTGVYNMNAVRN